MTDEQNGQIRGIAASNWKATYRTPLGNILTLCCESEVDARDWIENMARPAAGAVPTVEQKLSNILRNFHRNTPRPEADGDDIEATIDAILRATNVLTDDIDVRAVAERGNELRAAARSMVDDYQTSAQHHPNHVLVRLSAFEALRTALERPA
jgi:hypothetical protein